MIHRAVSTLTCLAALSTMEAVSQPGHNFGPMRIGLKMVTGLYGNDHGGELDGGKGERMTDAMNELGCDLTRIELRWTVVEKQRGVYDWSEYDRLVNFLVSRGIEPMFMMYAAPEWSMRGRPEDKQFFIDRNMENLHTMVWPRREYRDDFARFIETAANRYRGKVRLYEYWNEPDGMGSHTLLRDESGKAASARFGGDAILYAEWLRIMYPALKRGNPEAVLCVGSLTDISARYIEGVYASGAGEFIDAVSLHPYAHDGVHEEFIRNVRTVMTRYGDWYKPIWLTEFGWHCPVDPEHPETKNQAEVIRRVFYMLETRYPFISQVYSFTLNDWSDNERPDTAHGFGLLDYHVKTKKPGFAAMAEVLSATRVQERRDIPAQLTVTCSGVAVDTGSDNMVDLRLTAHNPFNNPLDAYLVIHTPWNPFEQTRTLRFTAPPGSSPVPLEPMAVPSLEPGSYPLGLATRTYPVHQMNLCIPAPVPRKADTGDITEQAPSIRGDRFKAWMAWDDESFYFACLVEDTDHHQTHKGWDLWREDSIQIALDPLREGVRGAMFRPDDTEFLLALTEEGPVAWRTAAMEGRYVGALRHGEVSVEHRDRSTLYRLTVPWPQIAPFQPQAGQIMGLSILINDWANGERKTREWGGGIAQAKEPYWYASIRLK